MARGKLWIGLDVGVYQSSASLMDRSGAIVLQSDLDTGIDTVDELLKPFKRRVAMVGLEAGAHATHLTRQLRTRGYPVAVFDTRQARKFLSIRQNKTDRNDADGLATIARFGRESVSEVFVKSSECQQLRSTLVIRQRMVRLRVAGESILRSLFLLFGVRLKSISSLKGLRREVTNALTKLLADEQIDLSDDVQPVLAICEAMRIYIDQLDKKLAQIARDHPVCRNFMEIPGVGPICALSFYTAIEMPHRFKRNADVGAYLGLVPRIKQSGKTTRRLRISKMGSPMTRAHLVSSAVTHLRLADSDVAEWGVSLGNRIGRHKAQSATARKLAIMMLAMWKSGQSYTPRLAAAQHTEQAVTSS
jgi:transposase